MGQVPVSFVMDADGVSACGHRIGDWVARQGSVKAVARQFDVSGKTVESWRQGNPPQFRHLCRMVDVWGAAFIEHVFAPVMEPGPDDLLADLRRTRQRIQAIEERLQRDVSENAGCAGEGMPAAAGQTVKRGGQAVDRRGRSAAGFGRRAAQAVAGLLIVVALAHAPLTAMAGDDQDLRAPRTVRVAGPSARTMRAGRSGGAAL